MVLRPMFLSSDILPKNDMMIGIIGYTQGITQLRIAPPIARRNIFNIDFLSESEFPLSSSRPAELKVNLSERGSPFSTIIFTFAFWVSGG